MMENGELAAKKFGVDWQDCVLQCGGERSSTCAADFVAN